jgi:translation initiation factor eIF-2B subunit alpha
MYVFLGLFALSNLVRVLNTILNPQLSPQAKIVNEEVRKSAKGFSKSVTYCRDLIYKCFASFIRDEHTILVHGNSIVVTSTLLQAAKDGKHFSVYVTEGRPACDGYILADRLRAANIPVSLITDTAVGTVLPKVDMVLCGAESVDKNGGVVNKAGTCQIAIACKALNKHFYVLCESYKFMNEFLLSQDDVSKRVPEPPALELFMNAPCADSMVSLPTVAPVWDYTHPRYVTLLFTDLGTLAPSAVSDEMFKLYY